MLRRLIPALRKSRSFPTSTDCVTLIRVLLPITTRQLWNTTWYTTLTHSRAHGTGGTYGWVGLHCDLGIGLKAPLGLNARQHLFHHLWLCACACACACVRARACAVVRVRVRVRHVSTNVTAMSHH